MMKSILVLTLFFVGAVASVSAAPTEVDDRIAYTTSLNAMAATVMNWYGSLIVSSEQVTFIATQHQWDDYRSRYPQQISQIQITSSDFEKLTDPDTYQFKVKSLISYNTNDDTHSQLINETFVFHVLPLTKAVIKSVTRDQTEQVTTTHTSEFNRSHYKSREFAYAWLAYLDGVDMEDIISAPLWMATADYSIQMGGNKIQGSVLSTLTQRKQHLAKGGHLLRSVDVKPLENKPDTYVLVIIAEWKGINQAGKPALAKIHQEIEYQLLDNNSWQIRAIKEKHLLPDIAPWIGLLC